MDIEDFYRSVDAREEPDTGWSLGLQALWWEKKGDWERAHDLCQKAPSPEGEWVHAYLHRKEGDLGNAAYWYHLAGKPMGRESLDDEWSAIVSDLMKSR